MYAKAIQPALENLSKIVNTQDAIKADSLLTQAQLDMTKATDEWRIQNQGDPNNKDALQKLKDQYDEILGGYRSQIAVTQRMNWDTKVNKLKQTMDAQNYEWGFKQNQQNTVYNLQDMVKANLNMASLYGGSGNINQAMSNLNSSYEQLLDYGAKNLGATEAARILKSYKEGYVSQYISGVADKDPQKALDMLEEDSVKQLLGDATVKTSRNILKQQKAVQQYELDKTQFENQSSLSEQLSDMTPLDAYRALEENKNNVSEKWYKSMRKELETRSGITAETKSEAAAEILLNLQNLGATDAKDFFKKSIDISNDIAEKRASGQLDYKDAIKLQKMITERQIKNTPALGSENDPWFGYDYADAIKDIQGGVGDAVTQNKILLDYFRTVENGDYKGGDKKALANQLIKKYKSTKLDLVSQGFIRAGYDKDTKQYVLMKKDGTTTVVDYETYKMFGGTK